MDIHLAVLPTQHHVLSDKDQNDWLDFITFCFHAKGTPRSHFARQLNNEPIHTILVARLASPTNTVSIVSTVRIFHRTIVPNIRTAGIGAVCTHPSYRKQGLSSKLLDFARQVIADMNAFDCSLLHCAPRFQSFYHQRGWTNTLLVETLVVDMVPTIHDNDTGDYIVQPYAIATDSHLPQLQQLHQTFSGGKIGADIRPKAFSSALMSSYQASIFVATTKAVPETVVGYCSLQYHVRDGCFVWTLCDLGVEKNVPHDVIRRLVAHAMHVQLEQMEQMDTHTHQTVEMPSCCKFLGTEDQHVGHKIDHGWLYYDVLPGSSNSLQKQMESTTIATATRWKIDGF